MSRAGNSSQSHPQQLSALGSGTTRKPSSPVSSESRWRAAGLVLGTAYFYWVEDVDIYGVATMHGPVSVDYTAPTAVTLSGIQASPAAVPALPMAGTLLALLALFTGALAVRRRT